MKIGGVPYRSIRVSADSWSIEIFDQRALPWNVKTVRIASASMAAQAIHEMWTRGAPLLAMTGAYGLCMALREDASDISLEKNYKLLVEARPTAVNLKWALDQIKTVAKPLQGQSRIDAVYQRAAELCDEDVAINKSIGEQGLEIIKNFAKKNKDRPVNILTHCNAGWLATVDFGTATAPIYMAHDAGIPVHVWVDETRPRNQGALTAFELREHGVPHTYITDNAGGLLMQQGKVDFIIVGTDRVTRNGDVCNKIGTYLKALAAHDNNIPFYVALPYTTFDNNLESGPDVPIEERSMQEVTHIQDIKITESPAANPAFDITPARLVTAYITDKGVFENAANLKRAIA